MRPRILHGPRRPGLPRVKWYPRVLELCRTTFLNDPQYHAVAGELGTDNVARICNQLASDRTVWTRLAKRALITPIV
eukprot:9132455-Alexandrium_andersonii.AAC.1